MGAGSALPATLWPEWPPPHMSTCWVSGWRAGWGLEETGGLFLEVHVGMVGGGTPGMIGRGQRPWDSP